MKVWLSKSVVWGFTFYTFYKLNFSLVSRRVKSQKIDKLMLDYFDVWTLVSLAYNKRANASLNKI